MGSNSIGRTASVVHRRAENRVGNSIGWPMRVVLAAIFLYITLPVTPILVTKFPALQPLIAVHMAVHALPLFITAQVDSWLFDVREMPPALLPVWSALTGAMLWPLAALSIWPALWNSAGWRKAIATYTIPALVATAGAAYWVFTHLGRFF